MVTILNIIITVLYYWQIYRKSML